jgi:hypothetical protein
LRIAHELGAETGADRAGKFTRRAPARLEVADQRHTDAAFLIDGIGARQIGLPVNENAQPVPGIETVGAFGVGDHLRALEAGGLHGRRAPGDLLGGLFGTVIVDMHRPGMPADIGKRSRHDGFGIVRATRKQQRCSGNRETNRSFKTGAHDQPHYENLRSE